MSNYQHAQKLLLACTTTAALGLLALEPHKVKADQAETSNLTAASTIIKQDDQRPISPPATATVVPPKVDNNTINQEQEPQRQPLAVAGTAARDTVAHQKQEPQPQTPLQSRTAAATPPISQPKNSLQTERPTNGVTTYKWFDKEITLDHDGLLTLPAGEVTTSITGATEDEEKKKINLANLLGENAVCVKKITIAGPLTIVGSANGLFGTSGNEPSYSLSNVTEIDLHNLITSKITDMTGMFEGCKSLTTLDCSNFDTTNVQKMSNMFSGCEQLANLKITNSNTNFNTKQVTTMNDMFGGCKALTALDLSMFDTSNVTDMSGMFGNCHQLNQLDISSFKTDKVTNMNNMFLRCESLPQLDVRNFNTEKVTSMGAMFKECKALTELNISSFIMNQPQLRIVNYRAEMLADLPKLRILKLGKDNLLQFTGLNTKGTWQNVAKGSIAHPQGDHQWSSAELVTKYDGAKDHDTYVLRPDHDDSGQEGRVTVRYQDEAGQLLSPEEVLMDKVGAGYQTQAKEIANYQLLARPANATGFYMTEPQTVIYVYRKLVPDQPQQPDHGSNADHDGQNGDHDQDYGQPLGPDHPHHPHHPQAPGSSNNQRKQPQPGSKQAAPSASQLQQNQAPAQLPNSSGQLVGKTAAALPAMENELAEPTSTAAILPQTGQKRQHWEQIIEMILGWLALLGGIKLIWSKHNKKKDK